MNEEQIKTLVECDQRSKSNTKRIDKLEANYEALNKLTTSVEVLATKVDTMNANLNEVRDKVDEQTAKPGKRWEAIVEKVIFLVVGAVVAFLFAKIGF